MAKPRDTWLYELKNHKRIVYIGISCDPDRRAIQHINAGKKFTHINVKSVALTATSAERRLEQSSIAPILQIFRGYQPVILLTSIGGF